MHSIVKKQFVQVDAQPVGASGRNGAPAARCKKSVRVLRVESRVHALEVTCTCGEATVVELEYPTKEES